MGNSNVSPMSDERVEKAQRKLHLTTEEVNVLYLKFSQYDREGNGLITRNDFFVKFLEETRTFFGDAVFNLIECGSEEVLTFGEFTEAITMYCLFETGNILRLCFNIFDTEKTGLINHDEIKHFIVMLHGGNVKSNAKMGLEWIDNNLRPDGRFGFTELITLHRQFPMLLYPVFRMQNTFMRVTFGESWWNKKKLAVAEDVRLQRSKRENPEEHEVDEKALREQEMEIEVKRYMGPVKYHLMPWRRGKYIKKIMKLKKIEQELQKREEFEADDR